MNIHLTPIIILILFILLFMVSKEIIEAKLRKKRVEKMEKNIREFFKMVGEK